MAVIDLTLNRLKLPGLANYTPPFGTKKAEDVALTTLEGCNNFTLPYELERPVVVSENSSCTGLVEHHSLVELDTANITFTLANGAFIGVKVEVICSASSGSANVLCGSTTYTVQSGSKINLIWDGTAWQEEAGGGGDSSIKATNVQVLTTDWVDESSGGGTPTYADYPFRADITIQGVTTDYSPDVRFGLDEAVSGIFAPIADTGTNKVMIYASEQPSATVTIPVIICTNVGV